MGRAVRESGPRGPGPATAYDTPKDEYIYSPVKVSFEQLVERWRGRPGGLSLQGFWHRSRKDGWLRQREEFWSKARELANQRMMEQAAGRIAEANDRHINLGIGVQGLTAQLLNASSVKEDAVNEALGPGERLRAIANLVKVGVDVERKGLGMADQIVYIHAVKEIVRDMLVVVERYVKDPDVYGNIVKDLQEIATGAEKEGEREGVAVMADLD